MTIKQILAFARKKSRVRKVQGKQAWKINPPVELVYALGGRCTVSEVGKLLSHSNTDFVRIEEVAGIKVGGRFVARDVSPLPKGSA